MIAATFTRLQGNGDHLTAAGDACARAPPSPATRRPPPAPRPLAISGRMPAQLHSRRLAQVTMGGSTSMVSKDNALPGRAMPMKVAPKHFVLGTPMQGPWPEGHKVMIFANGCFWGSEKGAWRLPGGGIYATAVGYAAGFTPNPTYEEACSGRTGHTEAVQVVFDPAKISFVDILRWFWESHDPTQGMGQGNDRGTQYRSGLYYADEEQKALIEASKAAYQSALGQAITTEVAAASDYEQCFYYGEDYHRTPPPHAGTQPAPALSTA